MSGRRRSLKSLWRDQDGNVVIYAAVVGSVLIGVVGLALDGSRFMITHTEAQAAADAAALAAGAQLDGTSQGCTNAKAAALVSNSQAFGQGEAADGKVKIVDVRCLTSLPASDSDPITAANEGTAATYVEVTTESLTHSNSLLQVVGAAATSTLQTSAVAGRNLSICRPTPMYMCNPVTNLNDLTFALTLEGRAFDFWEKLEAGSFGLLQIDGCDTNSGSCFREQMGSGANTCTALKEQIHTMPGQKTGPVKEGTEDRFDGDKNRAEYELDLALPGTWNCQKYWADNHGAAGRPAWCTAVTTKPYTRKYMYEYEKTVHPNAWNPDGETDRRVMYFAIVDCPVSGNENVPPVVYVEGLLLRKDSNAAWIEIVRMVRPGPGGEGPLKQNVQLYR